ncbi:hypothetical protein V6W75_08185 [Mannheimia sp. HC-2023]|uniref:hypothetical protein n=1 Tax=Mannheimia indoligenes TaxID=3103145 RepID=UPI002FE61AE2
MNLFKVLLLPLLLIISSCTAIQDTADLPLKNKLSQLSLVKENHLAVEKDNVKYLLDTYIQPFKRPYYIYVRTENNISIDKDIAVELAKDYIKTRGCTTEITRPFNSWDYDINNFRSRAWLIYLEC